MSRPGFLHFPQPLLLEDGASGNEMMMVKGFFVSVEATGVRAHYLFFTVTDLCSLGQVINHL